MSDKQLTIEEYAKGMQKYFAPDRVGEELLRSNMEYSRMTITPEQLAKSGSEHGEQAALFCWANMNLQTYPELKWLFAIPNGGLRDKITAGRLKAEGVKAGVPDICLPVRRSEYAALWIELKQKKLRPKRADSKGGVSDEQSDYINYLRSQGHGVIVCYGWEEAKNMILAYLSWGKNHVMHKDDWTLADKIGLLEFTR